MGLRVIRRQRQRLLVACYRFRWEASITQHDTESDEAFDTVRLEREGALVARLRRVQLALRPQRGGKVGEGIDGFRPQLVRLAIAGDRFLVPTEIVQSAA